MLSEPTFPHRVHSNRDAGAMVADLPRHHWAVQVGVGRCGLYLLKDWLSGCFSLHPPQVQSCVFSFQSPSKCGQETPIYSTLTFMPKTECAGFGMVGRAWAWGIRGGQEGHAGIQIFLLIHYRNPFLFSDKVAWMFVCFMPKMFFSPLELPF